VRGAAGPAAGSASLAPPTPSRSRASLPRNAPHAKPAPAGSSCPGAGAAPPAPAWAKSVQLFKPRPSPPSPTPTRNVVTRSRHASGTCPATGLSGILVAPRGGEVGNGVGVCLMARDCVRLGRCNTGYEQSSGDAAHQCVASSNGVSWDGVPIACVGVDCGTLVADPAGSVTATSTRHPAQGGDRAGPVASCSGQCSRLPPNLEFAFLIPFCL
jgi:hypothetical protein